MNYTVEWVPAAEQDLAAVWLDAADRAGVTAAAEWLDAALANKPLRLGRPLVSSVYRVASIGPLGVEFEVIEDDKKVLVNGAFAADDADDPE